MWLYAEISCHFDKPVTLIIMFLLHHYVKKKHNARVQIQTQQEIALNNA